MVDATEGGSELRLRGPLGQEIAIRAGTVTVLLGANGAGKTSLLEIAAGLRDPEGIRVSYGEEPLWLERANGKRRINTAALRQYAYASQAPEEYIVSRTAGDELNEALKPYSLTDAERDERIDRALAAVGWDTSWRSRDPFRMSGGERRRLALACLLAPPARWLLVDEPTAGLDAAGQQRVGDALRKRRDEGAGILLVSHDTEWALPLADRLLLLSPDGRIRCCGRSDLLSHPEWWEEAGMEVPEWLRTITPLLRHGLPPDRVWNPADLAQEWARLLDGGGTGANGSGFGQSNSDRITMEEVPRSNPPAESADRPILRPRVDREESDAIVPLAAFDPRSVWLAYVLLSLSIFSRHSWSGVAMAAVVVLAATALGRMPLMRWRGPLAGFLLFSMTVSLVAGVGKGWTFDSEAFLVTLQSMVRTLLIMVLGLGLALAITPLRLRRALEQLFSFRGRMPAWAQKFVLTVTLMLRFIPMFLHEWERFSRHAIARGKESSMALRAVVRRLLATALPFLLALFRIGDQVAAALESRGVGRRRNPTLLRTQKWRKRDTALAGSAMAAAALLWLWG